MHGTRRRGAAEPRRKATSGGIGHPEDALAIGRRTLELGFTATVGIIHDGDGQLQPLREEEREVYTAPRAMEKSSYARIDYFQDDIAHGRETRWRCRAGSRYLYICEDGLVHYCSQHRRWPAGTRCRISISGGGRRTCYHREGPVQIHGAGPGR